MAKNIWFLAVVSEATNIVCCNLKYIFYEIFLVPFNLGKLDFASVLFWSLQKAIFLKSININWAQLSYISPIFAMKETIRKLMLNFGKTFNAILSSLKNVYCIFKPSGLSTWRVSIHTSFSGYTKCSFWLKFDYISLPTFVKGVRHTPETHHLFPQIEFPNT